MGIMDLDFNLIGLKMECLIDGKIIEYGACSASPLQVAKDYYSKTCFSEYIGDGTIHAIGGQPQRGEEILHFFRKPTKI